MAEKKKINLKDLMDEFGWSGTRIFWWVIEEEYLTDLSGREWAEKYDEMRRSDASISSLLLACWLPIRSTKRYIQSSENPDWVTEDIDREMEEFLEDALFKNMDITWQQFLYECLTFLTFGFSVFEKVYKVDDQGKFRVKKLAFRHQKTITQRKMQNWEAWVMQQLDTPNTEWSNKGKSIANIPMEKLLVFTINQEWENYQWISILRPAYKHRYIKSNLEKFDAIRHQKQWVGVPVMYLPKNATPEDKKAAKEIIGKFKTNEQSGIVMPWPKDSWWEFEFADLKAWDKTEMLESIKYHTREIVKAALAQFIELGSTQSGSRALSEDQTDLFIDAIGSYAKIIEDVINRFLVKELIDLNFTTDRYPKLRFENLEKEDLTQFATAIQWLVTWWLVTTDSELENFVREKFQLPAKVEEENITETPEKPIVPEKKVIDPNNPDDKNISDVPIKAHDHPEWDLWCSLEDEYFSELCKMTNNRMILDIQKQIKDKRSLDLKKKWLKFNDYEDISPRPMTFAERKVNFSLLKRSMDEYGAKLDKAAAAAFKTIKKDLLDQIDVAIRNNDIASLGMIRARYWDKFSQELTDIQKELFEIGKKTASAEMTVEVPATSSEVRGALRVQNDQIVGKMIWDLENVAQSAAMQTIAKRGGSIVETWVTRVWQAVNAALDGQIAKASAPIRTLWLTMAVNLWRQAIFERYPEQIYAMQFSAILDDVTTDRCLSLDGRIVAPGSAAFYDYSPPQHYNCFDNKTEVYTENWWKLFSEIDPWEKIWALNPETLIPEFVDYVDFHKHKSDKIVEYCGRSFSLANTENHNQFVKFREKKKGRNDAGIRKLVQDNKLPNHDYNFFAWCNREWVQKDTILIWDKQYPAKQFVKFMWRYLSEWSTSQRSKNTYNIKLSQEKEWWVEKILDDILWLTENIKVWTWWVFIMDTNLALYCKQFGHSFEKFIPKEIKDLSKELIEDFLEAFCDWDGSHYKWVERKWSQFNDYRVYFTSSKRLADDLWELIMKIWKRPNFTLNHTKGKSVEFKNGTYTINHDTRFIYEASTVELWRRSITREVKEYNDYVYDVELEKYHVLLVRRDGKTVWSGNCRSVRVEILQEETFKPDISWIPSSIDPALSIDNVPQMNRPVLWKWSPAIWVLKKELADRQEKLDLLKAQWQNEFRQKQHQDRIDQLEKALKNKYTEYMKDILKADGVEFTE